MGDQYLALKTVYGEFSFYLRWKVNVNLLPKLNGDGDGSRLQVQGNCGVNVPRVTTAKVGRKKKREGDQLE